MLEVLQVLVFLAGLTAVCIAGWFVRFFARCKKSLSVAMKWILCEQIASGVVTLIFSANSLAHTFLGHSSDSWNSINPAAAIILRTIMFSVMIYSTVRLAREVIRIGRSQQDG